MSITIADVAAADFQALTQAGDRLGDQIGALRGQFAQGQQAVSQLGANWEGDASSAAVKAGSTMLGREQAVLEAMSRVQTVLSVGGGELSAARAAVVQGVQRVEQLGWQVGSDGTMSVRPGSVLDRYARQSPVADLQLRQLAATGSVQLKQLLADIEARDHSVGQKLREAIEGLGDAQDKNPDAPQKKTDDDPAKKTESPDKTETPPVAGQNPAEIAKQYQGRWATDLMDNSDLPMQKGIDPTVCCANFASAVLVKAGMLDPSQQTTRVDTLYNTLQKKGWTTVAAGQTPPPGAVAIFGANHDEHVELVESSAGGNITLIGSNNTGPGGSGPQHVSEETPWSKNIVYLVPPS